MMDGISGRPQQLLIRSVFNTSWPPKFMNWDCLVLSVIGTLLILHYVYFTKIIDILPMCHSNKSMIKEKKIFNILLL